MPDSGYRNSGSASAKVSSFPFAFPLRRGIEKPRRYCSMADNNGNIEFSYAKGDHVPPSAKTNKTHTVTYELAAGAVNGKTFGIDWSKVNSVSGKTYPISDDAKAAGLKWDAKTKKWVRPK